MEFRDSHPSDQELILAADGELSGPRAERLRKHLATCWECRVRDRELQAAVTDFVRLHRATLDPLLPSDCGPRALLKAQLDQLASSLASSNQRPRWYRLLQLSAWRPRVFALSIIAWSIGACVLASLAVFMLSRWSGRRELPVTVPTARLTPGAARSVTREEVCTGSSDNNRAVPVALRSRVFEMYGISGANARAYEVDYLITPALGGADDIRNLWPQSYSATIWNAQVKDALEDRLREMVCDGSLDLREAQREISGNWIAAYKKYFRTDRPLAEHCGRCTP